MPSLQSHFWRFILKRLKNRHLPLAEMRDKLEKNARRYRLPKDVTCQPGQPGMPTADWLIPDDRRSERVILYLHGGGYVMGSRNTYRFFAAHLARACGMRVRLLDYRLAPEHPFPVALDDTLAAFHDVCGQGIAPEQIVLVGDSAGGGLALAAAVALRDAGQPGPGQIVCLSPFTDLAMTGASIDSKAAIDPWVTKTSLHLADMYRGELPPTHPLLSPLYADLAGLPPVLVQVGSDEILLDDATRVAARIEAAGGSARLSVWPRMWHVFPLFAPYLPEANRALKEIAEFLHQR